MLDGALGGWWAQKLPDYSEAVRWALQVQPGATYFIRDGLGVGISLGAGVTERSLNLYFRGVEETRARDWELWLGPSALWELPFTNRVGLFVRPGVYYSRRFRQISASKLESAPGVGNPSGRTGPDFERAEYDAHFFRFALSVPLAFHISSSVAVGFGPSAWFDWFVSQHPRATAEPPVLSPSSDGQPTRGEGYSRTRVSVGLASWLGGSF